MKTPRRKYMHKFFICSVVQKTNSLASVSLTSYMWVLLTLTKSFSVEAVTADISCWTGTPPPNYSMYIGCTLKEGWLKWYLKYFRFPKANPRLLLKWKIALRRMERDGTPWEPSIHHHICSAHFRPDDYQIRPGAEIPLLRSEAVPSIFPAHTLEVVFLKIQVSVKSFIPLLKD